MFTNLRSADNIAVIKEEKKDLQKIPWNTEVVFFIIT